MIDADRKQLCVLGLSLAMGSLACDREFTDSSIHHGTGADGGNDSPDTDAGGHEVSAPDAGDGDGSAGDTDGGQSVVTPTTPYDPSDFLQVDGTRIENARGETVSLYGVNLGGWLVHESWMSPLAGVPDDSHMLSTLTDRFGQDTATMLIDAYQDSWLEAGDFANIAAEGLNVVRIPIYYLNVMDAEGRWKRDAAGDIDFARMDWAIEQAARHGLYSVPDLHGVPGSQNGWDHSGLTTDNPSFFDDEAAQAVAIEFWSELAAHYAGNSFVAAYDVLNEPNAAGGETLWGFYDDAIAAIRAADPDHIIVLETPWRWNQLPNPAERGWSNVIYSNHNYQWMNNDNLDVMRGFVDGIMNDANAHFPSYDVPLLIGEFTLFGLMESWSYGLGRFAEHQGINWTMWSYKVRTTNSTWGLYNLRDGEDSDANVPNVASDSAEQILAKWRAWKTSEHFQRNDELSDLVKGVAQNNPNLRRPTFNE